MCWFFNVLGFWRANLTWNEKRLHCHAVSVFHVLTHPAGTIGYWLYAHALQKYWFVWEQNESIWLFFLFKGNSSHSHTTGSNSSTTPSSKSTLSAPKVRKSVHSRIHEAVKAIALCHNVTPVYEARGETEYAEADQDFSDENRTYQASSPDEVSICLL